MKTWDEISKNPRLFRVTALVDPVNLARFSGSGYLIVGKKAKNAAKVMFGSCEGQWEHVSVSFETRDPTWEEMCVAKDVFWRDDEECYQIHPRKGEYVNQHKHCLHIWRYKD